uniref:Uncharacterized protein n=1 Tax=Arundo donax TaxID=35708 RepID=A0A0A9I0H5_ARUDO
MRKSIFKHYSVTCAELKRNTSRLSMHKYEFQVHYLRQYRKS